MEGRNKLFSEQNFIFTEVYQTYVSYTKNCKKKMMKENKKRK